MNVCKFCGQKKPEEEFYVNYRYKLGLRSWCTQCDKVLMERHDRPGLFQADASERKNPT